MENALNWRPHSAGEIRKRSFFLRLGLPSTLIRHETELFENAPQTEGICSKNVCTETFLKGVLSENNGVMIIK